MYCAHSEVFMAENAKVSTAELVRNFGPLADKALTAPLTITKNGRDRLVLLSTEEYARLKRRDREVVLPGQLTAEERAAIGAAEVAAEHSDLDQELKGWTP
jgi:prevent-host-death family protein